MHRCLAIPEASRIICSQLGPNREALCRLTVTCRRAFLDSALDPLWESQDSLIPLLGCLPNFWVPHEEPEASDQKVLTLNPTCLITPVDWDRVLFYFARIKKFSYFNLVQRGARPEVLEFIQMSFPGDLLSPVSKRCISV
ncbi:hypothetical protein B0H11DRAFT_506074 [Mycena galericulata]|nr:hypothetical protein B0H11DRAFT_506074 [Mycena galericulata]